VTKQKNHPALGSRRIGILTGGGDAPGLNGVIESCLRTLKFAGHEVIGIQDGFDGVFDERHVNLSRQSMARIHFAAGTILGTTNRAAIKGREAEFVAKFDKLKLDGLIAVGGDGTFEALGRVKSDLRIIGVPKTIDNDLAGTDVTFGFETAATEVMEAADQLRSGADAHRRVMIIETMGRTAGWIALAGGLASYADAILLPEIPFSREQFLQFLKEKKSKHRGLIVVASEGCAAIGEKASIAFQVMGSPQADRFGGFSERLARWIEKEAEWEARHCVLGHLQRARPPCFGDRILTQSMGVEIAKMVEENAWNQAVVSRAGQITRVPITDLMKAPRLVTPDHVWVKRAHALGIFTGLNAPSR